MDTIVRSILLNIVDDTVDVCNERATVPSGLPSHRAILPLLQHHGFKIVSSICPSPYSHIVQPKVLKQKKNDSCGYYALYNILQIAAAITSSTEEEAVAHLHDVTNRTKFWVTYTRLVKQLKTRKENPEGDKYPWGKEHIEKGILERPYVKYLMDCGFIQSNINITVLPDFSMTGMRHNRLPVEDLNHLSQIFSKYGKAEHRNQSKDNVNSVINVNNNENNVPTNDTFCNNSSGERNNEETLNNSKENNNNDNKFHAFLVGQACHWISIICNKVGDHVEILVFDSRNHNLLTSTHEDFMRILNKHKTLKEWKKEIYLYSLQEPQETARLFHDSIMGVRDIITTLLEHNMEGFLNSFEDHVEKSEMKEVWIVPFISWLEMHWPPAVVEANIIKVLENVGVSKLSVTTREKFLRMVKRIRESVDFEKCGIPVVQRFEVVVLWLEVAFSALTAK